MNIHEDDDPRPTSSVSLVIMHLNILLYITQSVQGEFEKKMIILKGAICFLYCLIGKQKREVGRQQNGKID